MCPAAYTGYLPVYPPEGRTTLSALKIPAYQEQGETDCRASLRLARNDRPFG